MSTSTTLRHGRIELALHHLAERGPEATGAAAHPLLLLHGLGERTPPAAPPTAATWPGPIWGLDFTGHGASTVPAGGGYTCEILLADADHALAEVGPATVVGRGLGGYIALLLAGARPEVVRGAVVLDGPGLAGGPTDAGSPSVSAPAVAGPVPPDPFALIELAHDVRPPDYATTFVRSAVQSSPLHEPIAVCAVARPEWLAAVADQAGVFVGPLAAALELYADEGARTG